MRASGYRGDGLFAPGAIRAIESASLGLLRRINVLADKALLAAYAGQASQVERDHVRRAVADSEFGAAGGRRWLPVAIVMLLVLGALVWTLMFGREFVPWTQDAVPALGLASAGEPRLSVLSGLPPPPATAPVAGLAPYPQVSPLTGLVGLEHLSPLGLPLPERAALLEKWGAKRGP